MKQFWITSGTYDYLKSLKAKDNSVVVMEGEETAVAFKEGQEEAPFEEARHYEIVDEVGNLSDEGYVVLNNIPVTSEGRPLFEERFKDRAGTIENEEGFLAIRILRPTRNNTYVVFTEWDSEASFKKWRESQAFEKAHQKSGPDSGEKPSFIDGPSYLTKLQSRNEE
ncbi:antibiotic biosynthesis monooxygenase family protein [Halalkalibacillus halophilus]|uniref:antibiotic biosynthesis monooxygenase family protein n=1 Tax=Halalkalibacillus halophilus TaxID=392827 RepID=UPI0004161B06|nr:antibiotic biosynthesis monooxygenase [Halalkalibacillus halophilus]